MSANKNVTNLNYLTELSKGNNAFVKDMIEIFLTENPEEIRLLESGINDTNYKLIKASAHKMKSTIPFVGLDAIIGEDLSEIEKLALENGNMEQIIGLFSKIKNICLKAIEELKSS